MVAMMAKSKKAKWVIGLTGTALSAFVIGQIGANQPNQTTKPILTKSMSKEEKDFSQLDWSNYNINGVVVSGGGEQSDRQTRRS